MFSFPALINLSILALHKRPTTAAAELELEDLRGQETVLSPGLHQTKHFGFLMNELAEWSDQYVCNYIGRRKRNQALAAQP